MFFVFQCFSWLQFLPKNPHLMHCSNSPSSSIIIVSSKCTALKCDLIPLLIKASLYLSLCVCVYVVGSEDLFPSTPSKGFLPRCLRSFDRAPCVCVTVSYFKAILLLHWNSSLSNINNNCSLPSFNLLAGFE